MTLKNSLDVRLFWNILLLCAISISSVFSHPQCLDFRPPFTSISPPLSFCTEYSNFGCCDRKRDIALKEWHSTILEDLCIRGGDSPVRLPVICVDHLRQLICSECSSYAAHVFEAESFPDERRSFPGLCEKFVSQLLPLCIDVLLFFTDDPKILNILKNHSPVTRDSSKDQINYFQCKQNQSKYVADDRWSMKNGSRDTADDQKMTHTSIAREQFTNPDRNESSDDQTLVKSFFELVRLKDETYCFPELLVNPKLVPGVVDAPLVEGQSSSSSSSSSTSECVCLERFVGGLRNPVILVSPNDSTGRIFIAEQIGLVHVFLDDGTRLSPPFLDLTRLVTVSSRFADERGLLGLAFHPKFRSSGRFFVFYTIKGSGDQRNQELIHISEFVVDRWNANRSNASSERSLLEIVNPYWNHNGGEIIFGVDGFLYAFIGDGGGAGDPHGHAQDKSSLLGKAIRIDVDRSDPHRSAAYDCPQSNPFLNESGARPEIFAYGIRDIWRCDVDEGDPETGHGRGRILCGDVGQSSYEEINLIQMGGNYGWNAMEGNRCFRKELCEKADADFVDPIFAYSHSVGQSVIGGHVYRGRLNPKLRGKYIYGDFMNGKMFTLTETKGESGTHWINEELKTCASNVCLNGLTSNYEKHILSFGEDSGGEIYLLTTNFPSPTSPTGIVYKIIDPHRRSDRWKCRSEASDFNRINDIQPPRAVIQMLLALSCIIANAMAFE